MRLQESSYKIYDELEKREKKENRIFKSCHIRFIFLLNERHETAPISLKERSFNKPASRTEEQKAKIYSRAKRAAKPLAPATIQIDVSFMIFAMMVGIEDS